VTYEEIRQRAQRVWEEFESDARPHILVGAGTCGRAAGAEEILEELQRRLPDILPEAEVTEVGCLGLCYAEPLVELRGPGMPRVLYGDVTADGIPSLLESYYAAGDIDADRALAVMDGARTDGVPAFNELPMLAGQVRIVLRNVGRIDPGKIDHYIARDGYMGLAAALGGSPEDVIQTVKDAGLRGRGGVGFPTGLKWELARAQSDGSVYLVANGEEGETGTFKDRILMESDPHLVLEGVLIAAYAAGAGRAVIFVQANYPLAARRMRHAVAQAEEQDICGDGVLGTDFSCRVEVRAGMGGYVCGEETGLLEYLEGKRGAPRIRPPYPAQAGLWDEPTVVNNVETLAAVPAVLREGVDAYRKWGTEESSGTKVFSLAGAVRRAGVLEFPLGVTLRHLIFEAGGGMPAGGSFQAALIGGPTGGYVPEEHLEIPVDFESLAQINAMMGSGGIIVADQHACIVDTTRVMMHFLAEECCGKCVAGRLGTRQMKQILDRISTGAGEPRDLALLTELARTLKLSALCGLGQAAGNPIVSSLQHFRDQYEIHIRKGRCPAGVCSMKSAVEP